MGHSGMVDSLIKDGLWDPYGDCHMGSYAELCAQTEGISREAQARRHRSLGTPLHRAPPR